MAAGFDAVLEEVLSGTATCVAWVEDEAAAASEGVDTGSCRLSGVELAESWLWEGRIWRAAGDDARSARDGAARLFSDVERDLAAGRMRWLERRCRAAC